MRRLAELLDLHSIALGRPQPTLLLFALDQTKLCETMHDVLDGLARDSPRQSVLRACLQYVLLKQEYSAWTEQC